MAVSDVSLKLEGLRQRPSSSEQLQAVADALLRVLQVGLKGNRAVGGSVWSVVTAATRAYPIQLSPSVEKAQIVADACPGAELVQTWALQAVADGSFIVLLQKLATQPQIVTAYAKDATVRDAKEIEQLVLLLEELKGLVTVAPYDSYMQRRPSESAAAPVHIQTEEDLLQQRHHQQQQHQSPVSEAHQDHDAACSATEQQPEQAAGISQTPQLPAPTVKPQALVRLFQRNKHDKASTTTSGSNNAATLNEPREQQPVQQARQDPEQPLLVRVQLQVPAKEEAKAGSAQHQVRLQLQVLAELGSNTAAANISRTSTGHSSSSSRLLGAGAGAVKGMFQSLQQSASAGLQHSAAAGQELGGAVAAAGEAAFGAISQPFAAVKGLASRAGSKKPTVATDVSSVIPQAAGELSDDDKDSNADPAAGSSGVRAVPSFFSRRPSSTAAAARAAGRGVPAAPDSSSNSLTAEDESYGTAPVLQVQLHVAADASHPVQLVVKLLPEVQVSGSHASSIHLPSWSSTKGLLGRIGMGRSSSSSHKGCTGGSLGHTGESAAAGAAAGKGSQGLASVPSAAAAASDEQSRIEQDVLEGDMWSVMERLKHTAGGVVPGHGTDATATSAGSVQGRIPAATSPTAAAAAAEAAQLQQQGQVLLQQLLNCCHAVEAAAATARGCLGDETEVVLQLVELMKALLSHGLRSAPATAAAAGAGDSDKSAGLSSKAAAAREALEGWLQSGKSTPAFGVLQALQHGSKQHPRLMLGADGIANMKAAKSSSAAVKLDMWVRASLNEQLLGVRLSTLVANAAALGTWYNSQALLLQQQLMQPLLQQVSQLCDHKFALLVGTAPANTTSTVTDGSADSSGTRSSSFVITNPSKLLGSFSSFGRGVLPNLGSGKVAAAGGSGDSTRAASPAAAATTAAAAGVAGSTGGTSGSSSSSSIPTFLWSALSSAADNSSATTAAGLAAGGTSSGGAGGGLFRRRRVAPIKEVRVPPPDSAAVLSPDASCALSPVSTAGDAAYAEWWSPNSSWQDFSKAEGLEGNASDDIGDGGGVLRNSSAGEGFGGGAIGLGTGGASSAEVLWDDTASLEQQQCVRSSSRQPVGSSEALTSSGSVQSEAALKLEQELAAAISAPVANMVGGERTRMTSSGAGSSRGSSRGSSGHELHRSSSAGWEAAVARARGCRAYSASSACAGLGSVGPHHRPLLHRRSRSPDASWPAAAPSEGSEAVGSSGAGKRVRGHMHKRSSSLNDLPELQALLGDLLQER